MLTDFTKYITDKTKLQPYYGKWNYCARLHIKYINYYRTVGSVSRLWNNINWNISRNIDYGGGGLSGRRSHNTKYAKDVNHAAIEAFVEWKHQNPQRTNTDNFKVVIERNRVSVYYNDPKYVQPLVDRLSDLGKGDGTTAPIETTMDFYKIFVFDGFKRDTIYHAKPKNKYRVYLTTQTYQSQEFEEVVKFFDDRPQFKPSYSLSRLLRNHRHGSTRIRWTWPKMYYDLDSEEDIVLTALTHPELVSYYCSIEQRPVINTI